MTKGLRRELDRGPLLDQLVIKKHLVVPVTTTITVVGATGVGFGGVALDHTFPTGTILLLGASCSFQFSGSGADSALGDTWAGDYALGTTLVDATTFDAADANVVASTAIAAATAEVSPHTYGVSPAASVVDNTGGTAKLYCNLLIDDADISGSPELTVSGQVVVAYTMLGNYKPA